MSDHEKNGSDDEVSMQAYIQDGYEYEVVEWSLEHPMLAQLRKDLAVMTPDEREAFQALCTAREPREEPEWWSRKQTAEYLGMSPSWLDHQTVIPRHRRGSRVFYRSDEVRQWADGRRGACPASSKARGGG